MINLNLIIITFCKNIDLIYTYLKIKNNAYSKIKLRSVYIYGHYKYVGDLFWGN